MIYTISSNDTNIEWGLVDDDRILQNVINLIRTRKYEIPFMREVGIDPDYTDNTIPYIQMRLTEEIIELVETYEDRAKVVEVEFADVDDNGNIEFVLKVEV